ncbi:hypothetical protein MKX01_030005 [Papaver californicum]|nr:hypothetical protein MKX01_030005 [Papaver californicum]
MSSSPTTSSEGTDHDLDHRLQQAIMVCTKKIVESQQASMDVMVGKLVEMLTSMTEVLNHQNVLLANISNPNAGTLLTGHKIEKGKEKIDEEIKNEITGDNSVISNASIFLNMLKIENKNLLSDSKEEEEIQEVGNEVPGDIQQENDDQVNQEINEEYAELGLDIDGLNPLLPLLKAIAEKDWKTAIRYVKDNKKDIEDFLKSSDFTKEIGLILKEASTRGQWKFVEELAKLAPKKALEFVCSDGFTILHVAVSLGNIKVVKALVNINPNFTVIRSPLENTPFVPLTFAAISASDDQKEILEYLYPITKDCMSHVTGDEVPSPFDGESGCLLVIALVMADSYGIALSIIRENPRMVPLLTVRYNLLRNIVERPFAFLSGSNLTWWERCIYSLIEANIEGEKDELSAGKFRGTGNDEENPPETSQDSPISKCFPTSYKGNMIGYISAYLWRCLMLGTSF